MVLGGLQRSSLKKFLQYFTSCPTKRGPKHLHHYSLESLGSANTPSWALEQEHQSSRCPARFLPEPASLLAFGWQTLTWGRLESSVSRPCPPPANTYLVTADLCGLGRYPLDLFSCPATTAPRTRQTLQQWDENSSYRPSSNCRLLVRRLSSYLLGGSLCTHSHELDHTEPCYRAHKSCCVNI